MTALNSVYFYDTIVGRVGIADNGTAITSLAYAAIPRKASPSDDAVVNETGLIRDMAAQLEEYLEGKRKSFDIALKLEGTPFQKAVWHALTNIPYGETRSYKEIAAIIGRPKACRAVGMANNRNPVAIVIPCHRVIGANGKMVGYAGGIDIKERLLEIERSNMNGPAE